MQQLGEGKWRDCAARVVQHSRFLNLASLEFVNQREADGTRVCVCVMQTYSRPHSRS